MNNVEIVMKALDVREDDARKIVKHFEEQDAIEWISDYSGDREEPLTDVHYESDFESMIDWQYDNCKPSEMLDVSSDIKDHPCMLQLEDEVIFWYGLV